MEQRSLDHHGMTVRNFLMCALIEIEYENVYNCKYSKEILQRNILGKRFQDKYACTSVRWRPHVTTLKAYKDLKKLSMEEFLGTLKVCKIELNEGEGQRKVSPYPSKLRELKIVYHPKSSKLRNIMETPLKNKVPMKTSSPLSQGRSIPEDLDGRVISKSTPRKSKTQAKWHVKIARNLDTSNPNILAWKRKKKRRKRSHSSRKRKVSWLHGRTLTCLLEKKKMKKNCLMANTALKDEDDKEKENDLLKKENESLKEEKVKDLSKVYTLKVNEQLQEEVINLRQSLIKFVNGSENLKKILKHKRHSYDKTGLCYDKKKKLKNDKSTSHCINCGKFKQKSYDCIERPKGPSKPTKTNKKGPKRI
ncbi:hypothetical protein CR513_34626, partial [Mucuna pruriens]